MDAKQLKILIKPMTVTQLASKLISSRTKKPITPQSIHGWEQVPIEHVKAIHQLTGIPKEQLRPELADDHNTEELHTEARKQNLIHSAMNSLNQLNHLINQ